MFYIIKHKISLNIKIKKIEVKTYNNSEYVFLDFFLKKKRHSDSAVTHIKRKFYFVNNFKIKMPIKINIIKSKQIVLKFGEKIMMILICDNIKISITFHRNKTLINRTMRAIAQVIVSIKKIVTISIQIRELKISKNRNYNFYSKIEKMLRTKDRYFAHITKFNIITVQIKNVSRKLYIIFKNFKIDVSLLLIWLIALIYKT